MICAAVERGAGIDVGKKWLSVCIMIGPLNGEPRVERQRFGVNVADLQRLREWLCKEAITHVVMESTGSYWKPVFNVLEDSVKVYLANPYEVKNRRGHKTDDKDGWWLAHLLRHAMIHPSFIPPRPIRELRDLTRRRERLNGAGTAEKNRVQKIPGGREYKVGQRALRRIRSFRTIDGGRVIGGKRRARANRPVCQRAGEKEDPSDHRGLGGTPDE